jgi:hypothetical protein
MEKSKNEKYMELSDSAKRRQKMTRKQREMIDITSPTQDG